jgi:hypothetical protein
VVREITPNLDIVEDWYFNNLDNIETPDYICAECGNEADIEEVE